MATYTLELTEDDSRRNKLRYLIVEGGKIVLRYSFDSKCGTPPTVYLIDPVTKLEIERLKRRHIISELQYDVLYPSAGPSSSENYDVTLLVALHRALLCGKPSNDPIWWNEPSLTDFSTEADIVRLRNFRNEFLHYLKGSGPTKTEFDAKWENIAEVLKRLGSGIPDLERRIEKLKTECIDKEYEKKLIEKLEQWDEQDKAFGETVIRTILTHSTSARSKQELTDVLGEHFVETELFKRAEKMLEDKGLVVLKGAQGEGKTTISKRLVKDPDRCLKVNTPKEWSFCSSSRVDIVLIDDMFGCAMFDKGECRKWLKHLHKLINDVEKRYIKVIITSRSYILEEVLEKMYISHLINDTNTLTISSKDLTDDEKRKILENHLKLNKKMVNDSLIAECVEQSNNPSSYIIGFPECARLFCKEENLFKQKGAFFNSPMTHIRNCLVNIFKSKEKFLAFFVLWAQTSQQLKLRDLEQIVEFTPQPILLAIKQLQYSPEESLRSIRGTLSNHTTDFIQFDKGNELFRFSHRVLSDAVGLVVHEKNQTALFNYCDAPFIERYININNSEENTDATNVGITVMPGRYDQLCLRVGRLILQGPDGENCPSKESEQYLDCTLLQHPAFSSSDFCAAFFKTMHASQLSVKLLSTTVGTVGASLMTVKNILFKSTFEMEVGILAYAVKQSLYCFASASYWEMKKLITKAKIAHLKQRLESDLSMTMLVATVNGDTKMIDFLVSEMGAQTDDCTLILAAIDRTNSEVLNLLLDKSGKSISHFRRNDKSPLIIFVEEKNIDAVKCIISSKHFDDKEINYQTKDSRKTALHIACKTGDQENVKELLLKNPDLQIRDAKQECPIHTAALAGNIHTVQLLLKHNMKQADFPLDLNGSLKDMKLYHIAVKNEDAKLIELLLNLNVSTVCVDGRKQTPLVFALQQGKCKMVEMLIDASIQHKAHTITDHKDRTAKSIATEKVATLKSDRSKTVYHEVISKISAANEQSSEQSK